MIEMTETTLERLAMSGLALLVVAVLVVAAALIGMGNYAMDDAYIVEHSVKGILAGAETRFIGSTPWQGVTSPLYVGALWLLALILPIDIAHWLMGGLSAFALVLGWYVLSRRSVGPVVAVVVAVVALFSGMTIYQIGNGLETAMAMAALTWILVAFDRRKPPIWGYGLLGSLLFIRPELAAVQGLIALFVLAKRPSGWQAGLVVAVGTLAVMGASLFAVSGGVVANTVSAKTYFFAEGCQPAAARAYLAAGGVAGFLGTVGAFGFGFALVVASRLRSIAAGFIFVFLLAYFFRFPGALWHNEFRYLYLLLPFAVLGWSSALAHQNATFRRVTAVIGLMAVTHVVMTAGTRLSAYVDEARTVSKENLSASLWVAQNVAPDDVVMVHDAGLISLHGRQPLVDLVGLKSPSSAKVHHDMTYAQCRRVPQAISEIAGRAGAGYMIVTRDWNRIFRLTEALEATGWTVERADGERGDTLYQVYRIDQPASE
ncbi:hypothetical protein [Frigidibacter sp. ROC022]|uniref:hypothetical protein n=1 Tax=Frigidibacter sp. ROC022 TaxID=2971796 RepID=UPI00215A50DC|nr:hypothetical protein [Frigidibacter sp. ROC022]MCR8724105.1 hypothetical protein [Frigidibacter sp. ROC022]